MKQNIIITGGLGYIGTKLCELYSGEAWFKNITVIDSAFHSERIKQLRAWGINFIQAGILDDEAMKFHLKDADIVFHLAGITDVAYTKTESNSEKDLRIKQVGEDGTKNIIKYTNERCKIIFPSTHVVFEGFGETKVDIDETQEPCPVLTYAKGKVVSENNLIYNQKNHVIVRLGSVYGYSNDSTRMNIMPNLFSRIASQDGTIKLFSGGVQLKSLVSIMDVARCLKFVAENDSINREIIHCSNETMTVREVAQLCMEYNPELKLEDTADEIPNLGYTISNKKLLATGFKFLYNIGDSIREMIGNWSAKKMNAELEYKILGGKSFADGRGRILNYELPEPINLIGHITSKRGSVRANHYHPIQEQKCMLLKGQYISVTKDLSDSVAQLEFRVINEGEIAVIKPNVAHAMVFMKDSIFLNLVRGERDHENYGVTHTIPYDLVDLHLADRILCTYKTECRCCGGSSLESAVSLGMSPLANSLLESADENAELFPLEMMHCPDCHNCQLSVVVPKTWMFDNYLYVSSTTASFRKHFEDAAIKYITEFNLDGNSLVIDIGSNDGVFLRPMMERGIRVLGIEPARNIAKVANENGIPTISYYMGSDEMFLKSAQDIFNNNSFKAKLVTASNVFAHTDMLYSMTTEAFQLLDSDGIFIIEVQYLLDTIRDLTFDNIYHEHVNYWSVVSLVNFFNKMSLCVYRVEHINTHGGSIRAYVKRKGCEIDPSVEMFLEAEKESGILDLQTYMDFGNRVAEIRKNVLRNIRLLKKEYAVIAGYGSPAKATTALNYFGINSDDISYIIEDNPLKMGKFIPGVNIPIKGKDFCFQDDNLPGLVIVMAWNFFDEIRKNNQDLIDKGVVFMSIKDLQKPLLYHA